MKRIISALLTVAMLVTLITVPMMVTADAWSAPSNFTNTSDFYNTELPTLYAVKGTPTIDGVKDAAWADAFTHRVDRSTAALLGGGTFGVQATIYVMWDANYLYILEERTHEVLQYKDGKHVNWDKQGSNYMISLPSDYTADENSKNNGSNNMTYVLPGNATEVGTPVSSLINGRPKYYNGSGQGQTNAFTVSPNEGKYGIADDAVCDAFNNAETGAKSFTTKTNDGYFFETRIPWNYLDSYCSAEYTPAADDIFGIIINSSNGKHQNNHCGPSNDAYGFQQIQLLDEGDVNPTKKPIVPDFSWYDKDETEFTITTAAQLLAMAELTNMHGSWDQWFEAQPDKFGSVGTAADVFKGKTIKLGADIDLNPGTVFNADGTWTGEAPLNGWGTMHIADCTFDGQGYTISGLYAPKGLKTDGGSYKDGLGFIGRMMRNVTVKNLNLRNGAFIGDSDDNVGSIAGLVNSNGQVGTSYIINCTSDLYLSSGKNVAGGIVGGNATQGNKSGDTEIHKLTIEDCVFTGSALNNINGQTNNGWDGGKTNIYVKNCYGLAGTTNKVNDGFETSDAAYVQETDVADGKINVRLLGLIDETELDLDSVGMKVTVTYGEVIKTEELDNVTDVFATINAAGTEIAVESLAGDYDYAYGVVLKGVPAGADDTVTIDVVLTRVIDGVEVQSSCTYSATYKAGVLQ